MSQPTETIRARVNHPPWNWYDVTFYAATDDVASVRCVSGKSNRLTWDGTGKPTNTAKAAILAAAIVRIERNKREVKIA